LVLSVVFPEIFADEGVSLISIAEGREMCEKQGLNYDDFNIYKFCIDVGWKSHLSGAFLELYR
jgi:hypothetical protein